MFFNDNNFQAMQSARIFGEILLILGAGALQAFNGAQKTCGGGHNFLTG